MKSKLQSKGAVISVCICICLLLFTVVFSYRLYLGVNAMIINEKAPKQKKSEVELWLNEKYGEAFRVLSVQTKDVLTEYDTYRVIAEGADENTDWFTVKEYQNRTDLKEQYEDDYYGILIRKEMEQTAAELDVWGNKPVKVYIRKYFFPGFLNEYTKENLLAEVKSAGAVLDADYYIFINAETMDLDEFYKITEELFLRMSAINQPGFIRVYGLCGQAFMEVNRENCEVYLQDYYRTDGEKCLALARRVIKKYE